MRVGFTIEGTMPLLMHWDNIEGGDELKAWRQAPENKNVSVAGDDRSPAWSWHIYCYNDGQHITMPQDNVMGALMYGGAQLILKKNKTFKELSQSGILIESEHLKFYFGDNQRLSVGELEFMRHDTFAAQAEKCKDLGFRLFVKRAKVGQSKHVRVRPRFDIWRVEGSLHVLAKEITFDVLTTMFEYAGRGGLCDWRPSSKKGPGPYGQFTSKLKKL